jgi:hypothetical protein
MIKEHLNGKLDICDECRKTRKKVKKLNKNGEYNTQEYKSI